MLSPLSFEISSKAGPMALHGPHHSAQKSTKTGVSACNTSAEKSLSVVLDVAIVTHPISGLTVLRDNDENSPAPHRAD
jgi:hypothetical protein